MLSTIVSSDRKVCMSRRNISVLFSLVFTLGCSVPVFAAPNAASAATGQRTAAFESADLINESGRLRMLTERMGKAYAQIALNTLPEKAHEQILQSQKRFEENIVFLRKSVDSPELRSGLEAVTTLYASYVKALARPANRENVAAAHRITAALVEAADKLTLAYQLQSPAPSAKIINIAGRQRMLSQRMARLYFAAVLNNSKIDADKALAEFRNALQTLDSATLTSVEIKRELALARNQWLFFELALQGKGELNEGIRNVATTSERLLEVMDNLTGLYGRALKAT